MVAFNPASATGAPKRAKTGGFCTLRTFPPGALLREKSVKKLKKVFEEHFFDTLGGCSRVNSPPLIDRFTFSECFLLSSADRSRPWAVDHRTCKNIYMPHAMWASRTFLRRYAKLPSAENASHGMHCANQRYTCNLFYNIAREARHREM